MILITVPTAINVIMIIMMVENVHLALELYNLKEYSLGVYLFMYISSSALLFTVSHDAVYTSAFQQKD